MTNARADHLQALKHFLRDIQLPGATLDTLGEEDHLVQSGVIDSLAIVQLAVYLENNHNIDFASADNSFERLFTLGSMLDLIEEAQP